MNCWCHWFCLSFGFSVYPPNPRFSAVSPSPSHRQPLVFRLIAERPKRLAKKPSSPHPHGVHNGNGSPHALPMPHCAQHQSMIHTKRSKQLDWYYVAMWQYLQQHPAIYVKYTKTTSLQKKKKQIMIATNSNKRQEKNRNFPSHNNRYIESNQMEYVHCLLILQSCPHSTHIICMYKVIVLFKSWTRSYNGTIKSNYCAEHKYTIRYHFSNCLLCRTN